MKKNISPHVNIYRFPLTAISSITNRITGVYLTGIFIGSGLYSLRTKEPIIEKYNEIENPWKRLINYSLIFPLNYHTIGGIRHFIWDKYPKFLENNYVKKSSAFVFGFSIASTIIQEKILN